MLNSIPIYLLLLPLLGAFLIFLDKKEKYINAISLIITGLVFTFTIFLYKEIIINNNIIITYLPFSIYGIGLYIDGLSYLLTFITAFIWFLSAIFAVKYMEHEKHKRRFYSFYLLALTGDLGVLISKDLFSIFVFFELMGLLSYVLIVHSENKEAFDAGKKYLSMTIIGGLSLLFGIFLYFRLSGTLDIYAYANPNVNPLLKIIAAITLISGFGVKAGMIPLHIWLPDAHPIAPTPASAVLSGVMIKTGAYGILRVTQLPIFSLSKDFSFVMGYTIIWIGIITMFAGVILALLQSNAKRLLAYHSVSQMGYILMGIGCALYLGEHGAIGKAGSIYHIINHALFKSSLFFAAGAVYLQTHEYNLYKLGGLSRKMPYLAFFTVIAACGISGIPMFNGYASKTLLHHAILESYHLKHDFSLKIAEIIFIITSAGTLCSFIKFTGLIFFNIPHSQDHEPQINNHKINENIREPNFLSGSAMNWHKLNNNLPIREDTLRSLLQDSSLNLSPAILAISILLLGIFSQFFIKEIMSSVLLSNYKQEVLVQLSDINFWDMHNLSGIAIPVVAGSLIFIIGMKFGLFHLHIPAQIGFDFWYYKIAKICQNLIISGYDTFKQFESYLQLNSEKLFYSANINISSQYHLTVEYVFSIPAKMSKPSVFSTYSSSYFIDKFYILYQDLCFDYNKKVQDFSDLFYNSFKKAEQWIMDLDLKRIEMYEYCKLRTKYLLLKKWIIPILNTHYQSSEIENIKSAARNLESLFELREKINKIRPLHHGGAGYSLLEIEAKMEEKSQFLNEQKEIYFKAIQRMLQYYTSDISFGIFLIIIVIAIYFLWIFFKI